MKVQCIKLKEFLEKALFKYLKEEGEEEILPLNVHLQGIDLQHFTGKVECFILPDIERLKEEIDEECYSLEVDIFIFLSGAPHDVLYLKAMRYGEAVKRAVKDYPTLFSSVSSASFKEMEYYEDVGGGAQGVRVSLSILYTFA